MSVLERDGEDDGDERGCVGEVIGEVPMFTVLGLGGDWGVIGDVPVFVFEGGVVEVPVFVFEGGEGGGVVEVPVDVFGR